LFVTGTLTTIVVLVEYFIFEADRSDTKGISKGASGSEFAESLINYVIVKFRERQSTIVLVSLSGRGWTEAVPVTLVININIVAIDLIRLTCSLTTFFFSDPSTHTLNSILLLFPAAQPGRRTRLVLLGKGWLLTRVLAEASMPQYFKRETSRRAQLKANLGGHAVL
jgi:hypothetical protein